MYTLKTGIKDDQRLSISDEIFGPGTRDFLRPNLRPGMRVLEVGCGVGHIACFIAKEVGETGSLVAVDLSEESLKVARNRATEEGVNQRIQFIVSSAEDLQEVDGKFDLVFCRFLLIHLKNPEKALACMISKLKSGGILCCEEPETQTHYCVPPFEPFSLADELTRALGVKNSVNYDLGKNIESMFEKLKDENRGNVTCIYKQVEITNNNHRAIYALSFKQIGQKIIDSDLASKEEVERILTGLWELANETDSSKKHRIFSFKRSQISFFLEAKSDIALDNASDQNLIIRNSICNS